MADNVRRYPSRRQIISRLSNDRNVYLIVSGRVRISMYAANGKIVSFRDLAAGSTFGEISAIDGLPRSADVEALEDSEIAVFSPQTFMRELHTQPEFLSQILKQMAATIRSLSDRLFELSTLGIQIRVRAEILRMAKEAGVENYGAVINPAPKHADIASRISVNREQVTKELSVMAHQGLVIKAGRTLVVPDLARLERIVRDGSR